MRSAVSTTSRTPSPSTRAVVDDGVVGSGDELVQPDPLDELRPRVDQGDGDVGAQPQMVGRQ